MQEDGRVNIRGDAEVADARIIKHSLIENVPHVTGRHQADRFESEAKKSGEFFCRLIIVMGEHPVGRFTSAVGGSDRGERDDAVTKVMPVNRESAHQAAHAVPDQVKWLFRGNSFGDFPRELIGAFFVGRDGVNASDLKIEAMFFELGANGAQSEVSRARNGEAVYKHNRGGGVGQGGKAGQKGQTETEAKTKTKTMAMIKLTAGNLALVTARVKVTDTARALVTDMAMARTLARTSRTMAVTCADPAAEAGGEDGQN